MGIQKSRDGIFLFNERMDMLLKIDDKLRYDTLDAILHYAVEGIEPPKDSVAYALFLPFKNDIDYGKEKKAEIQRRRSEAGKRGNEIKYQ